MKLIESILSIVFYPILLIYRGVELISENTRPIDGDYVLEY